MGDDRARRVSQNEALYRQVNERIRDMDARSPVPEELSVICECGDLECVDQVSVSSNTYERARENPAHFIVKRGHDALDVERPIDGGRDFSIVEKHAGEPKRVAEEMYPRR
jgi:hypothetical protein